MSLLKKLYQEVLCNKIYCILVLLVLMLLSSSPLIQFVVGRFVKITLVWGMFLIVRDIFKNRALLKNRFSLILALFCVSYAISILLSMPAHMGENISQFLYMVMFFVLLFGNDLCASCEKKKQELKLFAQVFNVTMFIMTAVCMVMFLCSMSFSCEIPGYGTVVVGNMYNRFWGLYNPNTGSTLSVVVILLTWMLMLMDKKHGKAFRIANIVVQMVYLLITQSRTAWYALLIFGGILFAAQMILKLREKKNFTGFKAIALVVAGTVVLAVGAETVRPFCVTGLAYVPDTIQYVIGAIKEGEKIEPVISERDDEFGSEYVDATNGRVLIWQAGIEAWKKEPIFGVTRENLYDKASPYLVEKRLENLKGGGLHNIYLTILVCAGVVGFAIMLAFFIKYCWLLFFKRKLKLTRENLWQWALLATAFLFFVTEFFEARILFKASVFSVLFWVLLGYGAFFAEKERMAADGLPFRNWVTRIEDKFRKKQND